MNSAYYLDEYERTDTSIWHKICRLASVLLLLTIMAVIIAAFLPKLTQQRNDRAILARLREELNAEKKLNESKQRKIAWMNEDNGYVEARLREHLGVQKDGEVIYHIDEPRPKLGPAIAPALPRR